LQVIYILKYLVNIHTKIKFLYVDPVWIDDLNNGSKNRNSWDIIEQKIDRNFASNDKVMIESLGVGYIFMQAISIESMQIWEHYKVSIDIRLIHETYFTQGENHYLER
jgi:hypothetical protein